MESSERPERRRQTWRHRQRGQRVARRRAWTAICVLAIAPLALGGVPARALDAPPSPPEARLTVEGAPPSILLAQLERGDVGPRPTISVERAPAAAREVDDALVQTLTALPLPRYVAPVGPEAARWRRSFGPVRAGTLSARAEAVAPLDHAGLSLSPSPRLWWRLDRDTQDSIEVTVVDETAIDPLLRVELAGPHRAGHGMIDLSQHDLRLEPGVEHRWFVTVVMDPERPSRNPVSAGSIRVLDPKDARRDELDDVPLPMRGHTLAERGVWYDAYDFFSGLAVAHPESAAIGRHRDGLLESATRR